MANRSGSRRAGSLRIFRNLFDENDFGPLYSCEVSNTDFFIRCAKFAQLILYFLVPGNAIILNLINYHILGTILSCPGMEYMVKFNLQKHLEQFHTVEERNSNPGDIIKVPHLITMFFPTFVLFSSLFVRYFMHRRTIYFSADQL
jgi:hypothetical protein